MNPACSAATSGVSQKSGKTLFCESATEDRDLPERTQPVSVPTANAHARASSAAEETSRVPRRPTTAPKSAPSSFFTRSFLKRPRTSTVMRSANLAPTPKNVLRRTFFEDPAGLAAGEAQNTAPRSPSPSARAATRVAPNAHPTEDRTAPIYAFVSMPPPFVAYVVCDKENKERSSCVSSNTSAATNASPPSSARRAPSRKLAPSSTNESARSFTVVAPARVHGVSVQTALVPSRPSEIPPIPSPADTTAPGGKTLAVLRVSVDSALGGVSHLCSAAETPPFSSSAVGATRPSNAHASGGRFPPSASARRSPPKFAPDRCTGRPAGGPPPPSSARDVAEGSAKFTTACSPNVTSAQSLPALSESPTPAKPLGEPEPARAGSTAHRATSPAPPEGNVSACGPRASKRHSACPSGREQRRHEEPADAVATDGKRERGNGVSACVRACVRACVSACVSSCVSSCERERERERKRTSARTVWKMRRGESREDRGLGEDGGCAPPGAKLRPCTASTAGSPCTA
jgi:hypothetical protein